MTILSLLPVIVSCLLMAAHFYRAGSWFLSAICLIVQLLLMSRQRIVPRLFTLFLLMSALEWLRTLYLLILRYQETGTPWHRLAMILTGVCLFTVLSPLTFKTAALKRKFSQTADTWTNLPDAP